MTTMLPQSTKGTPCIAWRTCCILGIQLSSYCSLPPSPPVLSRQWESPNPCRYRLDTLLAPVARACTFFKTCFCFLPAKETSTSKNRTSLRTLCGSQARAMRSLAIEHLQVFLFFVVLFLHHGWCWFCFCCAVLVFVGFVLVSRPSRHAALLAPGLPDGGSSTIWSTASPWHRCSRASAQAAPLSRRQARNAASCSRPREGFWRVSSPPAAGDHPGAPPIHLSLGTGGSSVAAKGLPASIAGRTGERVSIRI